MQTPESRGLPFAECEAAGDYPTLLIYFDEGSQNKVARVFFDSGARHNYVADSLLDELGVTIAPKHYRRFTRDIGAVHGKLAAEDRAKLDSFYSEHWLHVTISDGEYEASGQTLFRVVREWESSTFYSLCSVGECEGSKPANKNQNLFKCRYRRALISAAIAKDLRANIITVGATRCVRINADLE